jgi:hypothetical protein
MASGRLSGFFGFTFPPGVGRPSGFGRHPAARSFKKRNFLGLLGDVSAGPPSRKRSAHNPGQDHEQDPQQSPTGATVVGVNQQHYRSHKKPSQYGGHDTAKSGCKDLFITHRA